MLAGIFKAQIDNIKRIQMALRHLGLEDTVTGPKATTLETMAYSLAQELSADNGRFDHLRFYDACGFTIEENYPKVF